MFGAKTSVLNTVNSDLCDQKDDNGQKLGAIYFQPYDENDDPLAIIW
jgi:hypothetical protein